MTRTTPSTWPRWTPGGRRCLGSPGPRGLPWSHRARWPTDGPGNFLNSSSPPPGPDVDGRAVPPAGRAGDGPQLDADEGRAAGHAHPGGLAGRHRARRGRRRGGPLAGGG